MRHVNVKLYTNYHNYYSSTVLSVLDYSVLLAYRHVYVIFVIINISI